MEVTYFFNSGMFCVGGVTGKIERGGNVTSYYLLISRLLLPVVIPESDSSGGAILIAPLWRKKNTFVIVITKKTLRSLRNFVHEIHISSNVQKVAFS